MRDTVIIAQGDIAPGDIILQVNGDAVGGFIHWDLLCEIRRSGSLLTLLLVPQGKYSWIALVIVVFQEESLEFRIYSVGVMDVGCSVILPLICSLCVQLLCHYVGRCSPYKQRANNLLS